MNRNFLARLLGLCLLGAVGMQCAPRCDIEAVHPEKWPEIVDYIQRSWPDFTEKDPVMPAPYLYGLNPGTLYYWDVYFHNEGLMRCGYWDIARGNLDCMIFEIDSIGFIPTALHWGRNRSQTPFFSHSVRRYYEMSPVKDTAWLRKAYRAVLKEYEFWTNENGNRIEDHTTPIAGLQRYGHCADSAELVEFYDKVVFYRFKGLSRDIPVEEKLAIGDQMMAESECQDFTPRFDGRIKDFIPVCLNSYLVGYENNIAFYEKELGIAPTRDWKKMAADRAALIEKYCWSEERGLYLDYNFVTGKHSSVAAMAGIMPMFFGFAPKDHARRIKDNLPLFDSDGGLVSSEVSPRGAEYQYGHTGVWPNVQQMAIESLLPYGYEREARNIAMKWLNTATRNWIDPQPATYPPFKYGDGTRHPGFLYEKYTRDGKINDGEYAASHMLGWAGTVFLVALETIEN